MSDAATHSTTPATEPHFVHRAQQDLAGTLGVWIFLATEVLFFGSLFFGYLYVRVHFPEAVAAASRHTDLVLGTLNTTLLLTSSLCVALAAVRAEGDDDTGKRGAGWLLGVAMALGAAFLVLKGVEYHKEFTEHLFPDRGFAPLDAGAPSHKHGMQLFFILYFAMTSLHALHMLVGIGLLGWVALGLRKKDKRAQHVELAGLYWHFVDAVWIFLYPLLYLVGRSGGH